MLSSRHLSLQVSYSLLILLLSHFDDAFTVIFVSNILQVLLQEEFAQFVLVDVDFLAVFLVLVLVTDHLLLHHIVFVLADFVLFSLLDFLVFVGVLLVHVVLHLLDVLIFFVAFLILAIIDDLSLIVLILLLLNAHLVVLVLRDSLVALHAIVTLLAIFIFILDFTFTLVADFTLFIYLIHVRVLVFGCLFVAVIRVVLDVTLRCLVVSHLSQLHLLSSASGEVCCP